MPIVNFLIKKALNSLGSNIFIITNIKILKFLKLWKKNIIHNRIQKNHIGDAKFIRNRKLCQKKNNVKFTLP